MLCLICWLEQPLVTMVRWKNPPQQAHWLLSSTIGPRFLKVGSMSWLKSGQRVKALRCSSSYYLGHQRCTSLAHVSRVANTVFHWKWGVHTLSLWANLGRSWIAWLCELIQHGEFASTCTSYAQLMIESCFANDILCLGTDLVSRSYTLVGRSRLFLIAETCHYKLFCSYQESFSCTKWNMAHVDLGSRYLKV